MIEYLNAWDLQTNLMLILDQQSKFTINSIKAREYFSGIEDLDKRFAEEVEEIQCRLIDLGSQVATPRKADEIHEKKIIHTAFDPNNVLELEKRIDFMDEKLPPLKNFILPSGGLAASHIHVARTICRRAERNLIPLFQEEQIETHAYQYVNRLSDYLFMLARICAQAEGKGEVIYKKAKKHDDHPAEENKSQQ
ncbi:cob yrinic acid-diamide mitochondrial-like [Stylonychia lemnae]|uniref:Corrinoid adenosyltransferase MMAB n=1 Tax=Stylonychia lemnae TaxID=5949 RepID=A0A077ZR98_STYLE|nr:cob yrinic acid-diamide mitochondrial-like [Stylonychia lemnae]|eukprot:CDW72443.1 cob yrinic acid-diamide mitochondrial-like [Stylonychia lemnae]